MGFHLDERDSTEGALSSWLFARLLVSSWLVVIPRFTKHSC